MPIVLNLVGTRFGKLTVIKKGGVTKPKKARLWVCRCDCDEICEVPSSVLRGGRKISCGCAHYESVATHGMSQTPTYNSWCLMVQRTTNKNHPRYSDYGGRGIHVCKRWLKFENFLADMGVMPAKHSIERVDVNKGYFKANCIWLPKVDQVRNRRCNKYVTANGKSLSLPDWAKELNVPLSSLKWRYQQGWPDPKIINTPFRVMTKSPLR